MAYKRDELSKLSLAEIYYRGGYQVGFSEALASVREVLEAAETHAQELEAWVLDDPEVEREPPALAPLPRIAEKCRPAS